MPHITVHIDFVCSGKKISLFTGSIAHRTNSAKRDGLEIFNKYLTIQSTRSSLRQALLSQHNSTLYKQMIKAMSLYYVLEQAPRQIKTIRLDEPSQSASIASASLQELEVRQVISRSAQLASLSRIRPASAAALLDETPTGRAVFHAVTHLIKSLDTDSVFDRFERLWRAFNALYKNCTGKGTDHDCHVHLRQVIENQPLLFPLSIALVSPLGKNDIREQIEWNRMIQNNHPPGREKNLRESITRVKDERILEIYQDSLAVRRAQLHSTGHLPAVMAHLAQQLPLRTTRDSDVLSTLCLKYMYFVRNKIAHAERADHAFSFLTNSAEAKKVSWLVPILEALVIDLININHLFPIPVLTAAAPAAVVPPGPGMHP